MFVNSGNLTLLYQGFNGAFREGFGQAALDHQVCTLEVPSTTRTQEYGWLGQAPSLREWLGERVLRGIAEHGYAITNKKFESTIEVERDDIEDDSYGVYNPLFQEMGRATAAHPSELLFALLASGFDTTCYDGQYYFDTDHPVAGESVANRPVSLGNGKAWYLMDCSRMIKPLIFQRRRSYAFQAMDTVTDEHVFKYSKFRYGVDGRCNVGFGLWQLCYGSRQDLSAATGGYEDARQSLLGMKGDEGRPMGVMPTHLFVGPGLEKEGRELLEADRLANGATNVWRGTAQLVVTPWLQ